MSKIIRIKRGGEMIVMLRHRDDESHRIPKTSQLGKRKKDEEKPKRITITRKGGETIVILKDNESQVNGEESIQKTTIAPPSQDESEDCKERDRREAELRSAVQAACQKAKQKADELRDAALQQLRQELKEQEEKESRLRAEVTAAMEKQASLKRASLVLQEGEKQASLTRASMILQELDNAERILAAEERLLRELNFPVDEEDQLFIVI